MRPMTMVGDSASSDAALVAASLDTPHLFGVLYDRHAPDLYRYVYRRIGPADADDVVAQTFLIAFERRHHYDVTVVSSRPWLFGIATREISRHRRTERMRYRTLAAMPGRPVEDDIADRVTSHVAATTACVELARAMVRLSAPDRDTLLLYAWGSLSYEEVAVALNIPVGTVRSRLNRVRRRLREGLGGVDPTSSIQA